MLPNKIHSSKQGKEGATPEHMTPSPRMTSQNQCSPETFKSFAGRIKQLELKKQETSEKVTARFNGNPDQNDKLLEKESLS